MDNTNDPCVKLLMECKNTAAFLEWFFPTFTSAGFLCAEHISIYPNRRPEPRNSIRNHGFEREPLYESPHTNSTLPQTPLTQLNQAFNIALQHDLALVFWTGISPELARDWARRNGLKTLTMAMGDLYTDNVRKPVRSAKPGNMLARVDVPSSLPTHHHTFPLSGMARRPRFIQGTFVRRLKRVEETESVSTTGYERSVFLATVDEKSKTEIMQEKNSIKQKNVEVQQLAARQAAEDKKAAKRLKLEKEQQAAQDKKAAKRLKLEREQQAAEDKKAAKRLKLKEEQQAAQEKKAAKRLKLERERQAAQEKKAAKRLKLEREQQATQDKKAAKRLKFEREQQAAQDKKAAKRLKLEKEQQAAQDKKAAKRLKLEKEQQAAQDKKAAKRLKLEKQQRAAKQLLQYLISMKRRMCIPHTSGGFPGCSMRSPGIHLIVPALNMISEICAGRSHFPRRLKNSEATKRSKQCRKRCFFIATLQRARLAVLMQQSITTTAEVAKLFSAMIAQAQSNMTSAADVPAFYLLLNVVVYKPLLVSLHLLARTIAQHPTRSRSAFGLPAASPPQLLSEPRANTIKQVDIRKGSIIAIGAGPGSSVNRPYENVVDNLRVRCYTDAAWLGNTDGSLANELTTRSLY
ncbi:hypothetical protein KC336_g13 [Hortaea werneckii]|nr:hypothetical protein KC336_g13 [Hortaea werneckii]